jgi:TonB-dependent SusC/RagA subfamily outer membrane receptor
MRRCLRPFLCLPLLATTACAADAIAGPEPAPEPAPVAATQASAAPAVAPPGPAIFLCRARASISPPTNAPLYFVDGVLVSSDAPLAGMDPNDIESLEVLQGASLAALYGTRAVNGVVIIRTRGAASRRR